jgi:hypothetical protein
VIHRAVDISAGRRAGAAPSCNELPTPIASKAIGASAPARRADEAVDCTVQKGNR